MCIFKHFLDSETFKEILRFISDNRLHTLKAIIWNINSSIREDDLITRQARLINLFKEGEIWNNVIIICKKVIVVIDNLLNVQMLISCIYHIQIPDLFRLLK
jgi:hypothetical protein